MMTFLVVISWIKISVIFGMQGKIIGSSVSVQKPILVLILVICLVKIYVWLVMVFIVYLKILTLFWVLS